MSGNKKPRKKYRPRWLPAVNTLDIAMDGSSVPPPDMVAELVAATKDSAKAMREGVATLGQWSVLAAALALSKSIERQGKVRGLTEHLESAERALQAVFDRSNRGNNWRQSPLWFKELDAIRAFMDCHKFQMENLSRAEIEAVINQTRSRTMSQADQPMFAHEPERIAA